MIAGSPDATSISILPVKVFAPDKEANKEAHESMQRVGGSVFGRALGTQE